MDIEPIGQASERLVGEWDTEATHPMFPGLVVRGHSTIELLEGERFLIQRSRTDHPDFPDSISIMGDTDGLHMHYFDSRGVYRVYEFEISKESWGFSMVKPGWDQRIVVRFVGDDTMEGASTLGRDGADPEDDLRITYRRAQAPQ